MDIKRAKLQKLLMEELAELILKKMKDPRLSNVVITQVELSEDMKRAKVYFTTLEEGKEEEAEKAFDRARALIRAELLKRLRIRRLPELEFIFDRELKRMERIWERL
ncbi:MAG: 30S ribosome-binding factor RbfA [Aquificaceae bacterium]|nr:30S ribosome-binding factor RbfA [Aquificaceae bacterium]MDW8294036.1 30S ribosome-binding factor RbfA [Aquificaceae bacterium]